MMPGGTVTNTVDVDSNGRIILSSTAASDPTPTVGELLSDLTPSIAPLWADLDVTRGASITVIRSPGSATFVWDGVPQFDGNRPLTFQATLRDDNSITFGYAETIGWSALVGAFTASDAVVGISAGNGAMNPGEIDLFAGTGAGGSELFTFVDGFAGEDVTLQLTTRALNSPALQSVWSLRVEGIASGTAMVSLLLGINSLDVDLTPLGIGVPGCSLLVSPLAPAIPLPLAPGATESGSLDLMVGPTPALIGIEVFAQAAALNLGANPLGLELGNGIRGVIGF